MNRQNLNLIGKKPVDNSVALHNDLPNIISAYLGDNTTYAGELSQAICGYALRYGWRVWRDGIDTPAKPESPRGTPTSQQTDLSTTLSC